MSCPMVGEVEVMQKSIETHLLQGRVGGLTGFSPLISVPGGGYFQQQIWNVWSGTIQYQ